MSDDVDQDKKCPACAHPLIVPDAAACPECGLQIQLAAQRRHLPRFLSLPPMRYPSAYLWLVLMATLDIILTWVVINPHDGWEANPVAASVIDTMGFGGAILFKYASVLLAIVICEVVGRRNNTSGRQLAWGMVAIGAMPVAYTFALLLSAGPPPDNLTPAAPPQ